MDIAGFVGLASSGPINIPVPIEDPARFRELFGPDLSLAWDATEGRMATAFLGPAVEAFFRNGGRRCWVVRVAGKAVVSRFPLPTLLNAHTGVPAMVQARSEGSWADNLRVGAVLQAHTVKVFDRVDGKPGLVPNKLGGIDVTVRAGESIGPDDLLRVTYADGKQETQLLVSVVTVGSETGFTTAQTRLGRVFLRRPPDNSTEMQVRINLLASDATFSSSIASAVLEHEDGNYRLRYAADKKIEPGAGQILHAIISAGPLINKAVWLAVGDVEHEPHGDKPEEAFTVVRPAEALWPCELRSDELAKLISKLRSAPVNVEHLTFELVVWEGQQIVARLGNLGLVGTTSSRHDPKRTASRFWGNLPDDDTLFQLKDGRSVAPTNAIAREAFTPRFPLAAQETPASLCVPLAMPSAPLSGAAHRALEADPETTLSRDGLIGFSPSWFLDTELANIGVGALPSVIIDRYYLQQDGRRREQSAQRLDAIHAFWPLDEVTLLSAPDTVQLGWYHRRPSEDLPPEAPDRPEETQTDSAGSFRLEWSPLPATSLPEDSDIFELQEATDPLFETGTTHYRGADTHTYVYFGIAGQCDVDLGCAAPRYYRLRVRQKDRLSPWSETLPLGPAGAEFDSCDPPLPAPRLQLNNEKTLLTWGDVSSMPTSPEANAERYVLEAAREPTFAAPQRLVLEYPIATIYHIACPPLRTMPKETTYYRVRAERDVPSFIGFVAYEDQPCKQNAPVINSTETAMVSKTKTSPWSRTVRYDPPMRARWTMRTPAEYEEDRLVDDLRLFHEAALRFAAARGDVVTLLSLPAYYRAKQATAYSAAINPEPSGVARSFGAIYHPWVGVRDESGGHQVVRYLPPDGAVTGVVAHRALIRGAWVAPANTALRDVVALKPSFSNTDWEQLFERGVNLIRVTPSGFLPNSAETLAVGDLRPLNVRRLLILLRRLALREGHDFTFESNSDALRRRIRLRFESFLTRLFERGAFAGDSPEAAFQVRADNTVNPPESVDRGRLIVELRVAPSQPLAFLTVRLVHMDGVGLTVVES